MRAAPIVLVLALIAGSVRAEPSRPILILTAGIKEGKLRASIETNLPPGSRIDLLLQRRGSTLAAARSFVSEGHAEIELPFGARLPPTYYDVIVVGRASAPQAAQVHAIVSLLNGSKEAILDHRNIERTYYAGLVGEADRLFRSFLGDVREATRAGRDPADPAFRQRVAASLALVASFRNDLSEREAQGTVPLLAETQQFAVELIDFLLALHQELVPAGGAREGPLVLDESLFAGAEAGFRIRSDCLSMSVTRERSLGDADFLVHTLRNVERLQGILTLARSQDNLKASEINWRTQMVPFEEDLEGVEEGARFLAGTASNTLHPESFRALGHMVEVLRRQWNELGYVVTGRSTSWRAFDEFGRTVRKAFQQVVDPLGLDYLREDR